MKIGEAFENANKLNYKLV